MQLPITNIFGHAPSEWWGFVSFWALFWRFNLTAMQGKKCSFPSMPDQLLSSEVVELLLLTKSERYLFRFAVEEKLLLKRLLHEPSSELASCRKEETSPIIWALGASLLEPSPFPAPQGQTEASLWVRAAMCMLPRLINHYQLGSAVCSRLHLRLESACNSMR